MVQPAKRNVKRGLNPVRAQSCGTIQAPVNCGLEHAQFCFRSVEPGDAEIERWKAWMGV